MYPVTLNSKGGAVGFAAGPFRTTRRSPVVVMRQKQRSRRAVPRDKSGARFRRGQDFRRRGARELGGSATPLRSRSLQSRHGRRPNRNALNSFWNSPDARPSEAWGNGLLKPVTSASYFKLGSRTASSGTALRLGKGAAARWRKLSRFLPIFSIKLRSCGGRQKIR